MHLTGEIDTPPMQEGEHSRAYFDRLAGLDPEVWGRKYIYALGDPETEQIRYIGKSIRPRERLQNHMNEVSNCHRSHWLQSLKKKGITPELFILEEITGHWPWQESERYWIARFKALGCPLTNNTSGGDGVPNLPAEARAKIRMSWLGRKHKPESIEKLKAARALRITSEETKAKMSASQRGRKITWIGKLAEANRKITPHQAATITNRLAAGEKGKDLATEYGVDRTTISKIKMGTYFLPYRLRPRGPQRNAKKFSVDLLGDPVAIRASRIKRKRLAGICVNLAGAAAQKDLFDAGSEVA
jgi:hypothetical protein